VAFFTRDWTLYSQELGNDRERIIGHEDRLPGRPGVYVVGSPQVAAGKSRLSRKGSHRAGRRVPMGGRCHHGAGRAGDGPTGRPDPRLVFLRRDVPARSRSGCHLRGR
jgi:hypothetical protein